MSSSNENPDIIAANLAAVEAHFHSEATNEVEAALDLYTDDVVWEAPARGLRFEGKRAVADNYTQMFAKMEDVEFENLQRFATEDRVVDDSVVRFRLMGEGYLPIVSGHAGRDAPSSHLRDARRPHQQGNRLRDVERGGLMPA